MDAEQNKADIRRRLTLSRYKRRSEVFWSAEPATFFTDENDHNPTVLEDCPRCAGTGRVAGTETIDAELVSHTGALCPRCEGAKTTGEVVPFFADDAPAVDVVVRPDGWLKCPRCGKHFSSGDQNVWTGRRHKRCGQKLNLLL